MSNEIIKVLDTICDKFGLVIDWTSQNVTPYVEQLCEHIVQYELVSSAIYTVFITRNLSCWDNILHSYVQKNFQIIIV